MLGMDVLFQCADFILYQPILAHELGYTDAANFTRTFREWTGAAPSGCLP
jgi:YesN/AraC family two-component response regulator